MIIRTDIHETCPIPKDIKRRILDVGGKNPFDEPLFRLLLAQDRYVKAAGVWNRWRDSDSVEDRGGVNIKQAQDALLSGASENQVGEILHSTLINQPLGTTKGLVEIQLYPYEGFILEKWQPAHTFGSQEDWYRMKFEGEPLAGPYPEYGDYELIAGPTPYMPTAAECEEAIRKNFKAVHERFKRSAKERILLMANAQDAAEKKKEADKKDEIGLISRDNQRIFASLSLGAGRIRQALANKAGLKGHYGN